VKNPIIGIKIADGSYFPIMEEGSSKRKRLVLTTVNDNQESVQIDLYKGNGEELSDAVYVGSLLIENIAQAPKESSEIELKLGFDNDGTLNAEAGDPGSGQYESLSISMETLGESSMYDTPEFSLDDEMEDLQIDDVDMDLSLDELSLDDELEDIQLDDFDSLEEEIPVPDSLVPELVEGVEGDNELEDFQIDTLENDDLDLDSEDLSLDDEDFDFDDMEEEMPVPELVEGEAEDFEMEFDNSELPAEEHEDLIEDEDEYTPGLLSESEMVHREEKKSGNLFLIILFVIIAIAAIAGISYLLFRGLQGEDAPVLEAKNNTHSTGSGTAHSTGSGTAEETVSKAEAPEVITEDTAPQTESANVENQADAATTVQEITPKESTKFLDTTGVWYKIRWGDTLWGISYSFYDSPKDYNEIVKENKIKNPDIIFAETEIFIPSK